MTENLGRILLVEDDPRDVELTLNALEDYNLGNEVVVAATGKRPWTTSTPVEPSGCAPTTIPPSCSWI